MTDLKIDLIAHGCDHRVPAFFISFNVDGSYEGDALEFIFKEMKEKGLHVKETGEGANGSVRTFSLTIGPNMIKP